MTYSAEKEAAEAVEWLELDYETREFIAPIGARAQYFFNFRDDGYPSCVRNDGGERCGDHTGDPGHGDVRFECYGFGHVDVLMADGYVHRLRRYNIPLVYEHWRQPCP